MYRTLAKDEIESRIERFLVRMKDAGVDIALVVHIPDLFYFTGVVQQGILLVEAGEEPIYFVRRYHERAVLESPLKNIVRITSPAEIVPYLGSRYHRVKSVGLELDVMPVSFYDRLTGIFAGKEFVDISTMIREVRSVKSAFEIELMKRSGKKLVRLMQAAGESIREGKKEHEVFSEMVKFALDKGHSGTIRMRNWNQDIPFGHVLSGESGAVGTYTDTPLGGRGRHPLSPFGPGERVIKREEPIIVDMMWVEEGYATDMTRVYSIGKIEDGEILKAHETAMRILRSAEMRLKPRRSSKAILKESVNIAAEQGLINCFMGVPGNNVAFLGHGIGIEVDEFPFIAEGLDFTLKEGMTLALEPKFVLPGKGAVGVENTYVISPDGCKNLTEMEEEIIVI
ncbi:MAG: M24 family metallopeptidase [Deltaproteobacteria bacterium]|nr:M24 family metallopeptidase [Deltaproteobacteria bacterium]